MVFLWHCRPGASFEDPKIWRERATEARMWADMMRDNSSRDAMLRVAKEYDDMAVKKERNDADRNKAFPNHAYNAGRDAERERCAQIADSHAKAECTGVGSETAAMRLGAQSIAEAIRNGD